MGQADKKNLKVGKDKDKNKPKESEGEVKEDIKTTEAEDNNAFSVVIGVTEDHGISVQVVPGKQKQITMFDVLGAFASAKTEMLTQNIVMRLKQEIMSSANSTKSPTPVS